MVEPNAKSWITIISGFCRDGLHKEAVSLFLQKIQISTSVRHNNQLFSAVLKSCTSLPDIFLGKALHSYVIKIGHISCQAVSKALLNLYAKCGVSDDRYKLFGQVDSADPVTWNILLSGFASSRVDDAHVMNLFYKMHVSDHPKPNPVTIAIVLPVFARLGDIFTGKSLHAYVIKSGLKTHTLVGNALVSMYAKCGVVYDAYSMFDDIEEKDVVSWNAIFSGFSENKQSTDVFRLFSWMLRGSIKPNGSTIMNILPICGSLDKIVGYFIGREIHCYVLRRDELISDVSVCNALVSFYLRVGRMEEAEILFQRMKSRDLVSWNAIIAGYALNDNWLKAMNLFCQLATQEMIQPDSVTLISVLPACAHLKNLKVGKEIHSYFLHHPYLDEDAAVGNALVSFYAKCNDIEAAYRTFFMIYRKDIISWNSMLDTFSESGYVTRFLNILNCMLIEGIRPDSITVLTIIHFCTTVLRVNMVKEAHCYIIRAGLLLGDTEHNIVNALLDAYVKCSHMDNAFKVFQSSLEKRNLITFTPMISCNANCRSPDEAYIELNSVNEKELTTWNLMIRVYADNDFPDRAMSLFLELQDRGMRPNAVTIMSLLPVCSQIVSVHLLKQCHGYIIRACFDDDRLKGALLDLYAKCGSIVTASKIFKSHPHKDLVMFTAMVGGYAMHGMGKEALIVFSDMLEFGVEPDHVVLTAILSACSHAGLIDEGLRIFYSIEKIHGIKPTRELYASLVDLLARRGQIIEAYSLVTRMPVEANANVWGALLGACRTHHDVELGRVVSNRLFEMEANNTGNYVVMSNLYAADSRWDAVMEIRNLMKTRDFKKPTACSWIEVERRKNVFMAGDYSHPQRDMIYCILSILDEQIKDPFHFISINS